MEYGHKLERCSLPYINRRHEQAGERKQQAKE